MSGAALDIAPIVAVVIEIVAPDHWVGDKTKWSVVRLDGLVEGRRFDHDLLRDLDRSREMHEDVVDAQEELALLQQSSGFFHGAAWQFQQSGIIDRRKNAVVLVFFFRPAKEKHRQVRVSS